MTLTMLHPDNLVEGNRYELRFRGVTGECTFIRVGVFRGLCVSKDNDGSGIARLSVLFHVVGEYLQGGVPSIRKISWYRITGIRDMRRA